MGRQQSPEERAKRKASLKAYYETHEHHGKGRVVTDETKAKIAAAKREWWSDPVNKEPAVAIITERSRRPEMREEMSRRFTGRIFSQESRARMSISQKLFAADNPERVRENVERMATGNRGVKRSPEFIARLTAGIRAMHAQLTPEQKEIRREGLVASWKRQTPERREQIRQYRRDWWACKTHAEKLAITANSEGPRRANWKSATTSKPESAMAVALINARVAFEKHVRVSKWEVDFVLTDFNAVIEVDGDYWHSLPETIRRDREKGAYLEQQGIRLFRVKVSEMDAIGAPSCVAEILNKLSDI